MTAREKRSASKKMHRSKSREKLAWGSGGITEGLVNSIDALAFPIFSIGLGVSPALIGIAKAFPRLVDAFTDPIMGNISDNSRTRWGRRRPFIFIGAIFVGLIMPIIYMPPRNGPMMGLFLWLTTLTTLFFVAYTVWGVPWAAFGLELSDDYNDRTRLQIIRMIFSACAGIGVSWAYKLCFIFNPDEITGVRYVGWIIGGVMAGAGILSALFVREWRPIGKQPTIKLKRALKMTLSNQPFLLLCGTVLFFAGGIILVEPMLLYNNIYYVFGGDRSAASTMMGISGTTGVIISVLMLPLGGWVSEKIGKRHAAFIALSLIILGKGSQFWTVTPNAPYLQLLSRVVFQPGLMLMWALIPSMIADVCDLDELKSGCRREASFISVYQWIWKLGATLGMALGGALIALAGADVRSPDAVLSGITVFRLRLLMALLPALLSCCALICLKIFPLTGKRVMEIKSMLEKEES
jgi:GPH family glycoside/pentoside/hexuronide:cation symporter